MKKLFFILLNLLCASTLSAQQQILVTQNIPYDEHPSCILDLAQPVEKCDSLRPGIVIVHGGGWAAGDKRDAVYTNLLVDYAMQGYVTISVNYRLTTVAPMPACLEDVQRAVAWFKEHSAEYGVDPNRIGSFGHSAGGHLSLMLGALNCVTCAVGGAPPTEIGNPNNPWNDHPEWWPIGHIKKETAPMLILQGSEDPIVRPVLTDDYVEKMHKIGNKVEYIKVAGDHGVAFDKQLEFTRPAMDAFFAKHLNNPQPQLSFTQMKTPDGGGSGPYKAVALKEKSLPNFVVYRPLRIAEAARREGKLPILLFANGGCMDTSVGYERMLTEVASQGYVVVAIGEMQVYQFDRPENSTPSELLAEALDWITRQAGDPSTLYFNNVDINKVAAAGHSCGGAQVLFNAANPRLNTCLILNAGMGKMTMAGASKKNLKQLHCPVIYMSGGPSDVAYLNAKMDFKAIKKVLAVWADNEQAGHGGTYNQPFGGSFAKMTIQWLDWQLKGKEQNASIFLENQAGEEWSVKTNKK